MKRIMIIIALLSTASTADNKKKDFDPLACKKVIKTIIKGKRILIPKNIFIKNKNNFCNKPFKRKVQIPLG